MTRQLLASTLLAVLLPLAAHAERANEHAIDAQTAEAFAKQAAEVRRGLEPGGAYGYIDAGDRAKAEAQLDEIARAFAARAHAPWSAQDKSALHDAQEALNALLLQNDNNRLVCEHGARTGTRIPVKTCVTHGELMRREHQDRAFGDAERQPQTQRSGGG